MSMKSAIPNLVTLGNLACGVLAIVVLLDPGMVLPHNKPWIIAGLMAVAMVFDFADGFVARALKVTSEVGKQLDSLADLVSFGVLPGLLVYYMLKMTLVPESYDPDLVQHTVAYGFEADSWGRWAVPFIGLLIPLFSAYRLAKFNLDTRQTEKFHGLPTPPNAFLFLSLFLIYCWDAQLGILRGLDPLRDFPLTLQLGKHGLWDWMVHPFVLCAFTVTFSALLVSDIPLLALKFKNYSFKGNESRFIFLGISLILLVTMFYKAVPFIIALYFLFSLIENKFLKK